MFSFEANIRAFFDYLPHIHIKGKSDNVFKGSEKMLGKRYWFRFVDIFNLGATPSGMRDVSPPTRNGTHSAIQWKLTGLPVNSDSGLKMAMVVAISAKNENAPECVFLKAVIFRWIIWHFTKAVDVPF